MQTIFIWKYKVLFIHDFNGILIIALKQGSAAQQVLRWLDFHHKRGFLAFITWGPPKIVIIKF